MTLFEFANLCNVEIHIYHEPAACSKWICNLRDSFHEVFFKEDSDDVMARSTTGWGETPESAMKDLINNLKSVKIMVVQPGVHAQGSPRRTYNLPKDLTV